MLIICVLLLSLLGSCTLENPNSIQQEEKNTIEVDENISLYAEDINEDKQTISVLVKYNPSLSQSTPRIMELFLRTSNNMQLMSGTAGEAVEKSGKEFIVQEKESGIIRTVVYAASNTNTIEEGVIGTYVFSYTPDAKRLVAEILTDKPIFAPEAANEGLLICEPLVLNIN